jgi:hypothetical protein
MRVWSEVFIASNGMIAILGCRFKVFPLNTLENTLHKAGRKSIPKYRRLKTLKSVGRGIWNRNIDQAAKEARKAHWIWKNKGNSNGVFSRLP